MIFNIKEDFRNLLQQQMELPNEFSEDVLTLIEEAKQENINLKKYITPEHQLIQVSEILLGLRNKVDVTKYNDIDLTYKQMQEVRLGLEQNIDLTFFNIKPYSNGELKEIRLALQNKIPLDKVKEHMIGIHNMRELQKIRKRLENSLLEALSNNEIFEGISQQEFDNAFDDIISRDFGDISKDSNGSYTLTYWDSNDKMDPSTIEQIVDGTIELYYENIYSWYEDDWQNIKNDIADSLMEHFKSYFNRCELDDYISNKINLKLPYEEISNNNLVEVALLFATDKDLTHNLVPTSITRKGDNFLKGSLLQAICNAHNISLNELNELDGHGILAFKGVLYNDLHNIYFKESGLSKDMKYIMFIGNLGILDVLHLKEKSCKNVKVNNQFHFCDIDLEEYTDEIRIEKDLILPIAWLRKVQYLKSSHNLSDYTYYYSKYAKISLGK